jgi:hypothetical protein
MTVFGVRFVLASLLTAALACGGKAPPPASPPVAAPAAPASPDEILTAVKEGCAKIGQPWIRAAPPRLGGAPFDPAQRALHHGGRHAVWSRERGEVFGVSFAGYDVVDDAKIHARVAPADACARLRGWADGPVDAFECELRNADYSLLVFEDPVEAPPATMILCRPAASE